MTQLFIAMFLVKPGPMYRSHTTRQELAQLDLFEEVTE